MVGDSSSFRHRGGGSKTRRAAAPEGSPSGPQASWNAVWIDIESQPSATNEVHRRARWRDERDLVVILELAKGDLAVWHDDVISGRCGNRTLPDADKHRIG